MAAAEIGLSEKRQFIMCVLYSFSLFSFITGMYSTWVGFYRCHFLFWDNTWYKRVYIGHIIIIIFEIGCSQNWDVIFRTQNGFVVQAE